MSDTGPTVAADVVTPRLYHDDSLLLRFDARIVARARHDGAPSLVLSRTAFYPEAGGQMADRGTIDAGQLAMRVVDVQVDEQGVVHHIVEDGLLPAPGETVRGQVERARRRAHMALHTGQHMLSRALLDEARAQTVSARLGESACTIDVDVAHVDERAVARAEQIVNDAIDADLRIRAYFPAPDELASLDLRRAPKVDRDVRVVDIDGFDVSPCGGTHCSSSAQVGLVKVTGLERYKGKMRLYFVAGSRARSELGNAARLLTELAERLTTSPRDVAAAVDKLRAEMTSERDRGQALSAELARRIGDELLGRAAGGAPIVVASLPAASVELLRAVAGRITQAAGASALLAGGDGSGRPVVCSKHPASRLDCGATLKRIAAAGAGKGGGKPQHAEGRLPASADIEALYADVGGVAVP